MDKRLSLKQLVGEIKPGNSVAFGGGGIQRKPMAAAIEIARSPLENISVVAFLGGPEVDLLLGMGKVKQLSFAFVGFDMFGLAPNFRRHRESGVLRVIEYSEGTMLAAFEAAAKCLPFIPTRFGLDTDLLTTPTSPFKTFACPLSGETLLAVPALSPDIAIIHVNEADRSGNAIVHGDAYGDTLLARAAKRTFVTAERIVDDLPTDHSRRSTFISRLWIEGVVEAPGGAGMTALFPDYPVNVPHVIEYMKMSTDASWLANLVSESV
jgi:glutaconate CoA-transferase, subunit A